VTCSACGSQVILVEQSGGAVIAFVIVQKQETLLGLLRARSLVCTGIRQQHHLVILTDPIRRIFQKCSKN